VTGRSHRGDLSQPLAIGSGWAITGSSTPFQDQALLALILLPLDDYVDKKDWEDFLEQDRQIATYGGRILTLPWSSSSQPPSIHQSLGAPISITFRSDCQLH
jgi:hypothetical protein